MEAANKRILLVDDEKSFSNLLKLNLEQNPNFTVQVENFPEKVMDLAREFKPDVFILDIIMPKLSGLELAQQIRADGQLAKTPIIFVSAAISRANTNAWKSDIDGVQIEIGDKLLKESPVLVKPIKLQDLLDVIEEALPS